MFRTNSISLQIFLTEGKRKALIKVFQRLAIYLSDYGMGF
jgi:hypothetical protein